MSLDTLSQTICWLNEQLDKIIIKTEFLHDMILEEEDEMILLFLQKQLENLEKECILIDQKIHFEKKQLLIRMEEN